MSTQAAGKDEKTIKGVDLDAKRIKDRFAAAGWRVSRQHIGIVVARWNAKITNALLDGAIKALLACGVRKANIDVLRVPGAFELPFAAKKMISHSQKMMSEGIHDGIHDWRYDAIICIGCLIKGETMHFEYISESVSREIMALNTRDLDEFNGPVPVIFGVLTCLTEAQALSRAGLIKGGHGNHGESWGYTALEMSLVANYVSKCIEPKQAS